MCFQVVSIDVVNCVRSCNVSNIFATDHEVFQRFSVDKFDYLVHFGVITVIFVYF